MRTRGGKGLREVRRRERGKKRRREEENMREQDGEKTEKENKGRGILIVEAIMGLV